MKSTDIFKNTISEYLQNLATTDLLFAETLKKENKNIDDCITYILNEVKKSGCNGFEKDEIYKMAIHYYDEDNIVVGTPVTNVKIVVDHSVTKEEEEKVKKLYPVANVEKPTTPTIAPVKASAPVEKQPEPIVTPKTVQFEMNLF